MHFSKKFWVQVLGFGFRVSVSGLGFAFRFWVVVFGLGFVYVLGFVFWV